MSEVMTRDPATLPGSALVADLLRLMLDRGIGHVPLVEEGRLVGMVTSTDLTRVQALSTDLLTYDIAAAGSVEDMVEEGLSGELDQGTLAGGPGHYPDTALPGQPGNSSFAAHRDGNGAPLDHIDRLGTCDDITVETATHVFHYKVRPVDGRNGCRRATAPCRPRR